MKHKEDIETFFSAFESHMINYSVSSDSWAKFLAPSFSPEATDTYVRMPVGDKNNYERIKEKILVRFHVTIETYRIRLDQFNRKDGENWSECADRLLHLYSKWTANCSEVDSIRNMIAIDHLSKLLPKQTATHIKDRKPTTLTEAADLADEFYQVRR